MTFCAHSCRGNPSIVCYTPPGAATDFGRLSRAVSRSAVNWLREMTGKITMVAGLPGSGKSRLLNNLRRKITGLSSDDFFRAVIENEAGIQREVRFNDSLHYLRLVKDLRRGKTCLISDIVFCDTWIRHEAEEILRADVPGVEIEWKFFENSPRKCAANVRRRNRTKTLQRELLLIRQLSRKYILPAGVKPYRVWTPKGSD